MRKLNIYHDDGEIDISIIEEFEKHSGFCFPLNYKNLLSKHNGLYPVEDSYDFINAYSKKDKGAIFFKHYLQVGDEGKFDGDAMQQSLHISDPIYYGTPGLIDFGGYANGDYICFDYRHDPKTCNPKVVHVYHDDYTENEDGTFSMTVNFVANSFEEFIDMLYEYNE